MSNDPDELQRVLRRLAEADLTEKDRPLPELSPQAVEVAVTFDRLKLDCQKPVKDLIAVLLAPEDRAVWRTYH